MHYHAPRVSGPWRCMAPPFLLTPRLVEGSGEGEADALEAPQASDLAKLLSPTVGSGHALQVPIGVYSEHLGPFSGWSQTWIPYSRSAACTSWL